MIHARESRNEVPDTVRRGCILLIALYLLVRAVLPAVGLERKLASLPTRQTQCVPANKVAPARALLSDQDWTPTPVVFRAHPARLRDALLAAGTSAAPPTLDLLHPSPLRI